MSEYETFEYPSSRIKYILLTTLSIFLTGLILLLIVENLNPIDAIYFLIVTISTVGYGDFTPTQPITKIIVSIIIISGIVSIALISERFIDRIISINTLQYLDLPENPLDYQEHIVIAGFTNIAKNVALLFQGRFFRVVVIDPHAVAVKRARHFGFEAYHGITEEEETLNKLAINNAIALYLFMDDENRNVLTSLQARTINEKLLIYASTEHHQICMDKFFARYDIHHTRQDQ